MSHFYSSCQGGRGKATRCGHRSSGISAMARSPDITITTIGDHTEDNKDVFDIIIAIDNTNASVDNGKGVSSNANSFRPLRIVYDRDLNLVTIDHTISPGQSHNLNAYQDDLELVNKYGDKY